MKLKKRIKMRVWGLPCTRKVGTQVIESKKNKLNTRRALKRKLQKEIAGIV